GAWNQQDTSQEADAQPTSFRGRGQQQQQQQQQPNPLAQQIRRSESRALFYVVQARSAGCAPPPASTLYAANGPTG
ncbi:MAG TPA: hypothetical protein VE309_04530, partial [Caulobacteraceae bacterium]|nr:hypothetical protein [Caulobacteraceae bacterium]